MPLTHCRLCGQVADIRCLDQHHVSRRCKETMDKTIPLCRVCHSYVENNPGFARQHGFLSYHDRYQKEREFHSINHNRH
jgi:hypothetical protein